MRQNRTPLNLPQFEVPALVNTFIFYHTLAFIFLIFFIHFFITLRLNLTLSVTVYMFECNT